MHIYLIGFMGCGKTTHGRKLALRLGYRFVDTDEEIEKATGKTITEILKEPDGEQRFRLAEAKEIDTLSGEPQSAVVATGGGTPCFYNNMEKMIRSGLTVYIRMHPASLFHRLGPVKSKRPLIAHLTDAALMDFIQDTLWQREAIYNSAHICIKGENLTVNLLENEIRRHPLFANQHQSAKG